MPDILTEMVVHGVTEAIAFRENGCPPGAGRASEWSLIAIPPRILHLMKAGTTIGMNLYLGTQ